MLGEFPEQISQRGWRRGARKREPGVGLPTCGALEATGRTGARVFLHTCVLLLFLCLSCKSFLPSTPFSRSLKRDCTVQFSSVAQSCPTLCDPMNHSTPGLPVHHKLPEFTQTHVHRVIDAIQLSHPLLSPSLPAPNPSKHQSLFQ